MFKRSVRPNSEYTYVELQRFINIDGNVNICMDMGMVGGIEGIVES